LLYPKEIKKKKEKKTAATVELYKQAGIFWEPREVLEKHEPEASFTRTSRAFLKILNIVT